LVPLFALLLLRLILLRLLRIFKIISADWCVCPLASPRPANVFNGAVWQLNLSQLAG
jgi:hypothetical protein